MNALLERLRRGPPLVGDGAWGTLLFERGLEAGQPPESIQLARPEVVEEVTRLYLDAGADVVTTNTFGGSPLRLAAAGLEPRTEEVNARAVRAARSAVRAAARPAWIAGSVGPSGHLLAPLGDADPDAVKRSFRHQISVLIASGVDAILVETMTDLAEARLAVAAAREEAEDLPVFATMTFDPTPRGFHTIMGVSVSQAAQGLRDEGADAVGANCGHGIDVLVHVMRAFRAATGMPLIVNPNAGRPQSLRGRVVHADGPEVFAAGIPHLIDAGVALAGGCCGTRPDHIRALRAAIDEAALAGHGPRR